MIRACFALWLKERGILLLERAGLALCIHPSRPIFHIFPIYFIGSYKTPIIGQKLLYFL